MMRGAINALKSTQTPPRQPGYDCICRVIIHRCSPCPRTCINLLSQNGPLTVSLRRDGHQSTPNVSKIAADPPRTRSDGLQLRGPRPVANLTPHPTILGVSPQTLQKVGDKSRAPRKKRTYLRVVPGAKLTYRDLMTSRGVDATLIRATSWRHPVNLFPIFFFSWVSPLL